MMHAIRPPTLDLACKKNKSLHVACKQWADQLYGGISETNQRQDEKQNALPLPLIKQERHGEPYLLYPP